VSTLALGGLVSIGAAAIAPATARAATTPIACAGNTILVMDSSDIYTLDTSTMVSALVTTVASTNANALAINKDASKIYFVDEVLGKIMTYDVAAGTFTTGPAAPGVVIAGAVDPANGKYYYSGSAGSNLNVYDPATNTASVVGPETIGTSSNGDLVFDQEGNGYYLGDANIYRFSTTPDAAGNVALTLLATGFPVGSDGIAFGGDGYLYSTNSSTPGQIVKINPVSGAIVSTSVATGPDAAATNADAASCSTQPGTLSLEKNLPNGRVHSTDQFTLTVSATGIVGGNTATTTGTATGLQPVLAGPILGLPGTQYSIAETAAGGSLSDYTTSWNCVNTLANNAVAASGTGASGTFAFPAVVAAGENVVCTFTNAIELANTGTDSEQQLIIAALLIGVGGAFTRAGHRRRCAHSAR
jgi:hypothetical protein